MAKKLQADKWLFAAAAGLALFGVVMVYSASAVIAGQQNGNQYHYVLRQGIWTVTGLVAMLVAMHVNYRTLRKPAIAYGLLIFSVLLLLAVFGFPKVNGAHRWMKFGSFSIQPSEFSKLALIIFLAYLLEKRAGEERSFKRTFLPCVATASLFAGLIVLEPDLGTAIMLLVVSVVMTFVAGVRLLHLGFAAVPALIGLAGLLIFVPWRFQRLVSFLNPWADPENSGYQVIQSLIAVGSGGMNGLGFAQGKQKLFFLPFAHSDFIFAVVGEELGLLGALTVLLVFGILLWRGARAAILSPDRFGMLLGIGIISSIVVQALFNMSVVLAMVPTKGIPLPFISYGGSSLLPTMISIGILLNISQYSTSGARSRIPLSPAGQREGSKIRVRQRRMSLAHAKPQR